MGGRIYWKDGTYFILRYKLVYMRVEFEPLPKQHPARWSIK